MRSFICLVALAGCLDTTPREPEPGPAPRLMKVTPPPLVEPPANRGPGEELQFGGDVELRQAVSDGRLSLVPIVTKDVPAAAPGYLTLQAGLASGQVVAIDSGVIETITISNRSEHPLAILGGELVIGGEQDRLVVRNAVIPAKRSQAIAVVCAEPGRMSGGPRFHASRALAEPTLRKLAHSTDQIAVWERIGALDHTSWVDGTSYRSAAVAQRRGVNADRLRHLIAALDGLDRREERSKAVGFAVAIDDKVVAIEHFASPALYRDLREMVIASYLPGSVGKPHPTEGLTMAAVRAFKERTGAGAPVPPRNPVGAQN